MTSILSELTLRELVELDNVLYHAQTATVPQAWAGKPERWQLNDEITIGRREVNAAWGAL